jgi:hypothetical protein
MYDQIEKFNTLLWVKTEPNNHEKHLFDRAKKYIQKISNIPGIEMIAVVNSLSMYTTHKDSDIDLFIITQPNMIWFVRFFSTLILWKHRVWRKNEDIAGNFCLSFFIATEAMDLSSIALDNDIYLYYWIYYMKPIFQKNDTYSKFLEANNWVVVDNGQRRENQKYILSPISWKKAVNSGGLGRGTVWDWWKNIVWRVKRTSFSLPNAFGTFGIKSTEKLYYILNNIFKYILLRRTLKSQIKLGKPEWIIISDTMLKFHDHDKRREIRDTIFEKNFDK